MTPKPPNPSNGGVVTIHAVPEPAEALPHASLQDEEDAIVALVDELAILAAELWLEGKLDGFAEKEPEDDEDE